MEARGVVLRLTLDDRVVAEAPLYIYDAAAAWEVFQSAFAVIAPAVVGDLYNTVRVACHEDLLQSMGPQGIIVNLQSPPEAMNKAS